jgi:hypothetical protein
MLGTFNAMNTAMAATQDITNISKEVVLKLVAENNIVMTDIINKLGVHERWGRRERRVCACPFCSSLLCALC